VKTLRVFSIVFATLLAGCGFHLAGSRPLPESLRSTYIEVIAPYRVSEPPLEVSLRSLLQRRGGVVLDSAGAAKAVIRLSDLNESRQVLSIGTDGKVLEFQLVTRVTYQVNSGDKVLMPPDSLSLSRSYSFNAQQVLAKDAEEARLREYIQHELADLLLLRMESVLGRQSGLLPAPPGSPVTVPASSAPMPPLSPVGALSNSPGAATPR
jgi:LPS-assembly lipoprotein